MDHVLRLLAQWRCAQTAEERPGSGASGQAQSPQALLRRELCIATIIKMLEEDTAPQLDS